MAVSKWQLNHFERVLLSLALTLAAVIVGVRFGPWLRCGCRASPLICVQRFLYWKQA